MPSLLLLLCLLPLSSLTHSYSPPLSILTLTTSEHTHSSPSTVILPSPPTPFPSILSPVCLCTPCVRGLRPTSSPVLLTLLFASSLCLPYAHLRHPLSLSIRTPDRLSTQTHLSSVRANQLPSCPCHLPTLTPPCHPILSTPSIIGHRPQLCPNLFLPRELLLGPTSHPAETHCAEGSGEQGAGGAPSAWARQGGPELPSLSPAGSGEPRERAHLTPAPRSLAWPPAALTPSPLSSFILPLHALRGVGAALCPR